MTGIVQLFIELKNKLLALASFVYSSAFNGVGLNDATFSGVYTGATQATQSAVYVVEIDTVGAEDSFKVVSPFGIQTVIAITGAVQWIGEGLSVKFNAVNGHTLGDKWLLNIEGTQLIQFCQVWNNQTTFEAEGTHYNYPKPAVFVEFANLEDIEQLGNGNQIYNDMIIRLHIVQDFYNATDGLGVEEQNLTIFDLTQKVFAGLNKFEPSGAVALVRVAEQHKSDHTNIYEFIQDYRTNLVDLTTDEPSGFIIKPPVTGFIEDKIYIEKPFTKEI